MISLLIIAPYVFLWGIIRALINDYIIEKLHRYINHGKWWVITVCVITSFANALLYYREIFNTPLEMLIGVGFFNLFTALFFSVTSDPLLNMLRGKGFTYVSKSTKRKSIIDTLIYSRGFWAGYLSMIFIAGLSVLIYLSTVK